VPRHGAYKRRRAIGAYLAAGVLYSTNYAALKPDFWVVFSGTNESEQEANRRTAEARSRGYPNAYTRFVR